MTTLPGWLAGLADRTPTPGGGAAAALSTATAAALVEMVTAYTTGPKWTDREPRMTEINAEASTCRAEALALMAADEQAFAEVGAAYKLPRTSDAEKSARSVAIQRALVGAAEPPVRTGDLAVRIIELAAAIVEDGNPQVISDVAVAASAARAGLSGAIVNIEINASGIRDADRVVELTAAVRRYSEAIERADAVVAQVRGNIGA